MVPQVLQAILLLVGREMPESWDDVRRAFRYDLFKAMLDLDITRRSSDDTIRRWVNSKKATKGVSFDWLLLIAIALALSGANIVGYVRCKQEAGTRLMSGLQGVMGRTGMGSNVMGQALQSAAGKAFGL